MSEQGKLLDTNTIAEITGAERRFIRRYIADAALKKELEVTQKIGMGKLKYVDPIAFAKALRKRGFVEAARKLEAYNQ